MPCFTWNPIEVDEICTFENLKLFIRKNSRRWVCLRKIIWESKFGENYFYRAWAVVEQRSFLHRTQGGVRIGVMFRGACSVL